MFLADFSNSTPKGLPCTTQALVRSGNSGQGRDRITRESHSLATPLLYLLKRCITVKLNIDLFLA